MLIVGVDTETTGLKVQKGDKIIEIAMAVYDEATRRRVGAYTKRINPLRSIHPDASAVHGILLEDLVGAPVYKDVAGEMDMILQKTRLLVAHNLDFDLLFLDAEQSAAGFSIPSHIDGICTMEEGRWACPDGKSPSLKELAFALNVDYDPAKAHGALYDIDVTMGCFWRGVDLGLYKLPGI
jgi:DNA polymerase-3 subunit epsilon